MLPAALTDHDRRQLAAILAMLGSDAAGERDNAARLAEAFRRKRGLDWVDIIIPHEAPSPPPAPPRIGRGEMVYYASLAVGFAVLIKVFGT